MMAEAGATQDAVAQMIGTEQGRVSKLLSGKQAARFSVADLMAIESGLDLPAGEIFRRVAAAAGQATTSPADTTWPPHDSTADLTPAHRRAVDGLVQALLDAQHT